jgi:magnesium transporter
VHRLDQPFISSIKEELDPDLESTTASIVTQVVRYVLQSYEQPAMKLGEQVDTYESTVLLKHTKPALLQGLYYLKRKASTYKKVLLLTDDVVNFLKTTDVRDSEVQDVRDLYTKLILLYDQVLDDVTNLMNTYLSLATQKTNEVMKVLTIFSVFFMPLTFIVGVYGMNFEHMPELRQSWAYPAVLGLMAVITLAIFIMFKKRKWL